MTKRDLIKTKEHANVALAAFDNAFRQMFEMFTIGLDESQIDYVEVGARIIDNLANMIETDTLKINGVVDPEVTGYIKNIVNKINNGNSFIPFAMEYASDLKDMLGLISKIAEYCIVYEDVNVTIDVQAIPPEEIVEKVRSGNWAMSTSDENVTHSLNFKDFQSVLEQVLAGIEHGILNNVLIAEIK